MHVQWNIGQWGTACGPRPSGGGSGAGSVTVNQAGSELSLAGLGRQWSTTQCWEQYPGLVRRSHSAGARGWRNVCKTDDSDPRQATVVTTLSATDQSMAFDETGQYQFVINGQNCTASVRRTRTFHLVQREGEAAPQQQKKAVKKATPVAPDMVAASQPVQSSGRCATKGSPARLEVRPARKLMRPGESFRFRSEVADQKGCVLGIQPTWQIVQGSELLTLGRGGNVEIHPDAGEGEVRLSASARGQSVEVVIEVVPKDRYEALLEQRGFNAEGESKEAAAASIAGGSIGAKSAVSQAGSNRRTTFVAVTGALALLVGVVGLFLVQRRRRQRRRPADPSLAPEGARQATGLSKRCPQCGREFFGDEQFCTEDATPLVASSSPPGAPPSIPPVTNKICPICGAQYPGRAQFCGNDGSTLVPVN